MFRIEFATRSSLTHTKSSLSFSPKINANFNSSVKLISVVDFVWPFRVTRLIWRNGFCRRYLQRPCAFVTVDPEIVHILLGRNVWDLVENPSLNWDNNWSRCRCFTAAESWRTQMCAECHADEIARSANRIHVLRDVCVYCMSWKELKLLVKYGENCRALKSINVLRCSQSHLNQKPRIIQWNDENGNSYEITMRVFNLGFQCEMSNWDRNLRFQIKIWKRIFIWNRKLRSQFEILIWKLNARS